MLSPAIEAAFSQSENEMRPVPAGFRPRTGPTLLETGAKINQKQPGRQGRLPAPRPGMRDDFACVMRGFA
jgi:hypothetical protein